jgi:hypothetical protein
VTSTDDGLPGLLEVLARVPDPRRRRGRRYTLVFMLAVAVACVLAGAKNFREIGDQAGDLPQEVLARLGGRPHPLLRTIIAPSEKRIRTVSRRSARRAHHADPDIDRPSGYAYGCAQITRLGTAPGDRHSDLIADHNGGYLRTGPGQLLSLSVIRSQDRRVACRLCVPQEVQTRGYRSQSLPFSSACLINGRVVTCSCWSRSAVLI